MAESDARDVVVIGAGPAGLAAAIQLRRCGLAPLVFEKSLVGGLLKNANLVENYPGFPGGISGTELLRRMARHLEETGVEWVNEEVTCLDIQPAGLANFQNPGFSEGASLPTHLPGGAQPLFRLQTAAGDYCARQVVLASGTRPHPWPVEIPQDLVNRVFSEVYPLLDERGRKVVIVGAGDAAFDYALNLAGRGNQVVILNRDRRVKCLPLLWERAAACPEIRYFEETPVIALRSEGPGGTIRVHCGQESHTWDMMAHFLIFATGRAPEVGFLSAQLHQHLPLLTGAGLLYPVGDVRNGLFRQSVIAAGDGLRAAMEICRSLDAEGG
jgi:thioredoxin reductase (NADPH)